MNGAVAGPAEGGTTEVKEAEEERIKTETLEEEEPDMVTEPRHAVLREGGQYTEDAGRSAAQVSSQPERW